MFYKFTSAAICAAVLLSSQAAEAVRADVVYTSVDESLTAVLRCRGGSVPDVTDNSKKAMELIEEAYVLEFKDYAKQKKRARVVQSRVMNLGLRERKKALTVKLEADMILLSCRLKKLVLTE